MNTYILEVQQFYDSEQVQRFKVTFKEKEMILERRLMERQPWKVKSNNFKGDMYALAQITGAIEKGMDPPSSYVHQKKSW